MGDWEVGGRSVGGGRRECRGRRLSLFVAVSLAREGERGHSSLETRARGTRNLGSRGLGWMKGVRGRKASLKERNRGNLKTYIAELTKRVVE